MRFTVLIFIAIFLLASCSTSVEKPAVEADMIIFNGPIYTVSQPATAQAVAIKADSILAVGTKDKVMQFSSKRTKQIDLAGRTMIPGLIEGHAHIMGVGYNLLNVDLREAKSYTEVVDMVAERAKTEEAGTRISGMNSPKI